MKRTIKRILAVTTLAIVVTFSGLFTIVLFPQPLFANKVEHKQFSVYSNDKITSDIIPLLDNALALVEKSEINDPNYKYDILLAYNSLFNELDDKLLGEDGGNTVGGEVVGLVGGGGDDEGRRE